MSEQSGGIGKRQSKAKKIRYALYAMLLLASFLWLQYDRRSQEAALALEAEARQKAQAERLAEKRRYDAVYALVEKAGAAKEKTGQIAVYDEIINGYQADKAANMSLYVAWAKYKKAMLLTETAEKSALFEEVLVQYHKLPDRQIKSYVSASLNERLKLAPDNAAKRAFCDSFLTQNSGRLSDGLKARLLLRKAEATEDTATKNAIYDNVMADFMQSADLEAVSSAMGAALSKMRGLDDKTEAIRLCDLLIDAYMNSPQTGHRLFEQAAREKARLIDDPSLPETLFKRVIADNKNEEAVIEARLNSLSFAMDTDERLAAYEAIIQAHQKSKNDSVQYRVAQTMARKADYLDDEPKAQIALLRAAIQKFESLPDSRAKRDIERRKLELAKLTGDTAEEIARYSEKVAAAESDLEAMRALKTKADLLQSAAEKISLYDEIIDRGLANGQDRELKLAWQTMLEKAEALENKQDKSKLYDSVLFDLPQQYGKEKFKDDSFTLSLTLRDRVKLSNDEGEKLRLYDRFLEIYGEFFDSYERLSFISRKIDAVSDPEQKARFSDDLIRQYAEALKKPPTDEDQPWAELRQKELASDFAALVLDRARLMSSDEDRLKLYKYYLAQLPQNYEEMTDTTVMFPGMHESILFKTAELSHDPALKTQYFKDRIEKAATEERRVYWSFRQAREAPREARAAAENELIEKYFDNTDQGIEEYVSEALLDKIRRAANPDEQKTLVERLIVRYQGGGNLKTAPALVAALALKANNTDDEATKLALYDEIIQKYQHHRDYSVKRVVDRVIADKFRLEQKMTLSTP